MKYFIVHKSIYAVNIWRQSLIKLWHTPSAGAAAVSSIHNLVREDLAELYGKQVASKEAGINVPALYGSQLGSSEMDINSAGAAGLSQSGAHCPLEKSLSCHLQQVRTPLQATGYLVGASSVLALLSSPGGCRCPASCFVIHHPAHLIKGQGRTGP